MQPISILLKRTLVTAATISCTGQECMDNLKPETGCGILHTYSSRGLHITDIKKMEDALKAICLFSKIKPCLNNGRRKQFVNTELTKTRILS